MSSESAIGVGDIGILKDVLHISNIPNSIISTTKLSHSGYTIFQSNSEYYISDINGHIVLRGKLNGKLWMLNNISEDFINNMSEDFINNMSEDFVNNMSEDYEMLLEVS